MKNRSLHAVDIENLAGTAHLTSSAAEWAAEAYRRTIRIRKGDIVIVASSRHNALAASFVFDGARLLWRDGVDGAELALIEVLETERVAERFDTVVIGSGDGKFAEAAAFLGVDTHVIAIGLEGSVSARLRLACHETLYLTTRCSDWNAA